MSLKKTGDRYAERHKTIDFPVKYLNSFYKKNPSQSSIKQKHPLNADAI